MNYFFCVLLLLTPLQVYGWWDTGHMLVAQVAWKHLNATGGASQEVLNALENALGSLVTYSDSSDTFVTAACWMDDIKSRGLSQFSNWHYINLPICEFPNSTDTDSCAGISVHSVLYSGDEDVTWAIKSAISTMTSKYSKGFERGFALRNLLHLVGDIHQPLHAVALFNEDCPHGDEGGNKFYIKDVSFTKNLHGLWDSGLGLLNNSITRPLSSATASYLSDLADKLIAKTANLTAHETYYNITQSALDSRELAMKYAYNISNNTAPSQEYIDAGWPIIEQQLGLAGYRLALLLNRSHVCDSTLGNCPDLSVPAAPGSSSTVALIALGVVLGISVIVNIVLTYSVCKKSAHSEESKPLTG